MGNYRFRLSDMIPNAWFYKLKDMSRTKNHSSTSNSTKKKLSSSATSQKPHLSQPRQSYYYTIETSTQRDKHYNSPTIPKASDTHFPDSPRRSSKRKPKRKTIYKPSPKRTTSFVPADCNCQASLNSVWIEAEAIQARNYFDSSTESSAELDFIKSSSSEFEYDAFDARQSFNGLASWSSSCSCRFSSSAADIIFDMNEKSYTRKLEKVDDFSKISEMDLPPILTKPAKFNDASEEAVRCKSPSELEEIKAHSSFSIKIVKEESIKPGKEKAASPAPRKSISQSTGVKVRANSPKLASKKFQGHGRKSVSSNKRSKSQKKTFSESFAVVKASFDPEKDFRDSMMEMIVENNIRASKDLEELLACYLSLNLDEYHDLIIKAFEQIWFSMPEIHV